MPVFSVNANGQLVITLDLLETPTYAGSGEGKRLHVIDPTGFVPTGIEYPGFGEISVNLMAMVKNPEYVKAAGKAKRDRTPFQPGKLLPTVAGPTPAAPGETRVAPVAPPLGPVAVAPAVPPQPQQRAQRGGLRPIA